MAVMLIITVTHAQYSYTNENSQAVVKSVGNIASDDYGNLVFTGSFDSNISFGSFTLTTSNVPTSFIAKKLANGNYSWAKAIIPNSIPGVTSSVSINGVSIDAAGNAYVTGGFKGKISFDNITLISQKKGQTYYSDMFTAKILASGAFQWAKLAGTTNESDPCWGGFEWGNSVTTDNAGNIYAVGVLVDKVFRNTGTCAVLCGSRSTHSTSNSVYVVKYNSSGTRIWEKKYINSQANGSICNDPLSAQDVESDGTNIYISGNLYGSVSFGNVTLNAGGTINVFLLKLDANGNTVWATSVTNAQNTFGWGDADQLYLDKNTNDLYLSGRFSHINGGTLSFGGPTLTSPSYAFYNAKYSSAGICLWATLTEGAPLGVTRHPNGNLAMLLRQGMVVVDTFSIKEIAPVDGSTVALTTAEVDFSSTWFRHAGIVSVPNGFIFCQYLTGSYNLGGITISSSPGPERDIVLVKYTMPAAPFAHSKNTTTEPLSITTAKPLPGIILFPNPASNQVSIQNNNNKMLGLVSIYDGSGKIVYQNFIGNSQILINVKNFAAGVYYVRADQLQVTIKFVKQ